MSRFSLKSGKFAYRVSTGRDGNHRVHAEEAAVASEGPSRFCRVVESEVQPVGLWRIGHVPYYDVPAAGQPSQDGRNHREGKSKDGDPVLCFSVLVVDFPTRILNYPTQIFYTVSYLPVVAERGGRKAVVVCGHEMSSVDALVETGIS